MNEDYKFWIIVWTLVCIGFCVLVVTVGVTTYKINKEAFENGYECASLPGVNEAHWVKIK
jgi:hypothetical protein